MAAKHLRIHGRVQGVSYRYWTIQTATSLELTGWVRNRNNGTVEALVMGEESKLQKLIQACHDGPPMARVDKIDITDAAPEDLSIFEARATI